MMDQERMMILQMVADGQISAEEGVRLLNALGQEPVREPHNVMYFTAGVPFDPFAADFTIPVPPPPPPVPGQPFRRIFKWVAESADGDFDTDFDFDTGLGDFI